VVVNQAKCHLRRQSYVGGPKVKKSRRRGVFLNKDGIDLHKVFVKRSDKAGNFMEGEAGTVHECNNLR